MLCIIYHTIIIFLCFFRKIIKSYSDNIQILLIRAGKLNRKKLKTSKSTNLSQTKKRLLGEQRSEHSRQDTQSYRHLRKRFFCYRDLRTRYGKIE